MVPDDPGVVIKEIEEIDHRPSLVPEPELRALIDVADIEQEGVWIFAAPGIDLGCAPGQAAEVGMALVIDRRQNMPMQIGRVQETQPNDIARRLPRPQPARDKQDPARPAKQAQKLPAIWKGNSHRPWILTAPGARTIFFAR